jgi:hypothetical protein
MTVEFQVIQWRDIPAQVKVRAGKKRKGQQLSKRFQAAISAAALRAGKTDSEEYMSEWYTTDWQEREGEPEAVIEELMAELENSYPKSRLQALVRKGGLEDGPLLEKGV